LFEFDVIVLGAGAAGLLCAATAAKRGRKVALLEHTDALGKKILISGGGRCNFTHLYSTPANFLSSNPHFAKSALARYTPQDFLNLVRRYRIPFHEKTPGQLFCDNSAKEIVSMLQSECREGNVSVHLNAGIVSIRRASTFCIETGIGTFKSPVVVVATGGLSIPKLGASGFGYDIARQFGLRIVPPRPALVPLVFSSADRAAWSDLAGVAASAKVSFRSHSFLDRILFTHRGLSGPAILQISSYWDGSHAIRLDLLPDAPLQPEGNKSLKTTLSTRLPKRLAERWLDLYSGPQTFAAVTDRLRAWDVIPGGTEGFAKAEVTAGGVHTDDLSSKSMEARSVTGLFFIGEVVDVTGHLGGHNFQWAWSSAVAAGQAA
jgi:predicted Rossmann fold flavoprotein